MQIKRTNVRVTTLIENLFELKIYYSISVYNDSGMLDAERNLSFKQKKRRNLTKYTIHIFVQAVN